MFPKPEQLSRNQFNGKPNQLITRLASPKISKSETFPNAIVLFLLLYTAPAKYHIYDCTNWHSTETQYHWSIVIRSSTCMRHRIPMI